MGTMAKLGSLANNVACVTVRGMLVRFMTHMLWVLALVLSAEGAVSAVDAWMLGAASVVVVVLVAVPAVGIG